MSATADGADAITFTAQIVDGGGHGLAGCDVTLAATGTANGIGQAAPTDANGDTTATLVSTVAEIKTVSATVSCGSGGVASLDETPAVEFVHGPIIQLVFVVQPTSIIAGLDFAPPVAIGVADAEGNIATDATGNITIGLAPNGGSVGVSGTPTVALVAGLATFTDLTVRVPGQAYQLVASTSVTTNTGTSDPFDVTLGPPSTTLSALQLAPSTAPADGVSAIGATVTIVNAGGVAIPGLDVTVQMSGAGGDVFPPHGTTDAAGHFVTSLTSTVVGAPTVTATSGSLVLTATAMFTAPPCTLLMPGSPSIPQVGHMVGMTSADFDGDGHADIVVLHPSSFSIYRGVGDGRLHTSVDYPTASGDTALAVGDLDGDGHPEVIVTNGSTATIYKNPGNGLLSANGTVALGAAAKSAALGDVDGNGTLDLIVRSDQSILLALGAGDDTFAPVVTYPLGFTASISLATVIAVDINGDNRADVVTVGDNNELSALLANPNGTLQNPIQTGIGFYFGGNLSAGKLDGDTFVDLVMPSPEGLYPLTGHGDGTFTVGSSITFFATYGTVVADFDGNGSLDVAASESASGSQLRVFLNNGSGTLQESAGVYALIAYGSALAAADFDGDGHLDIASEDGVSASGTSSFLTILTGDGTGAFHGTRYFGDVPGSTRQWFVPVAGDFNKDGFLDLFAESTSLRQWSVQLAASDGTLTAQAGTFSNGSPQVSGDFNGDGKLDALLGGGNVNCMRGNGDGTLQAPVSSSIGGSDRVTAVDINHDSILDVVGVSQVNSTVNAALGNGDCTFGNVHSYPVGMSPDDVLVVDLDADGNVDIVVSNQSSAFINVLKGVGDGTFMAPTTIAIAGSPSRVAAGDFNHDGHVDLVVANYNTTTISFLAGKGDTTFIPPQLVAAGGATHWVAAVDLDGDGDLDILALGAGAMVLAGNGDGTFRAPQLYPDAIGGYDAVALDFDRDGRMDLIVPSGVGNFNTVGYALLSNRGCR